MIGRQSPKCYTEQVMGTIKELTMEFSNQNVLKSFGFKTDIGQISQGSSQGVHQNLQSIQLDKNTAFVGLYGSFENVISSLGIITLDIKCSQTLHYQNLESKFLNQNLDTE